MALILEDKKLNEECMVERGYLRVLDVSYSYSTKQARYDLALYASEEERNKEKLREATKRKYVDSSTLLDYFRTLDEQGKTQEKEEFLSLSKELLMSQNLIVGMPGYEESILYMPEKNLERLKTLLWSTRGFSKEELIKDFENLKLSVRILMKMGYGSQPSENDFVFDSEVLAKAYKDLKTNIQSKFLEGNKDG